MKQEAMLAAIDGLERYDESRPLENFLSIHIRNRLYNLKRNKFYRPDTPCLNCPLKAWVKKRCTKFDDRMDCDIYARWDEKTQQKIQLNSHKESDIDPIHFDSPSDEVEKKEIFNLIDKNIPMAYRENWIRFYTKAKLPKAKRLELLDIIKEILESNNICQQNLEEED